MSFLHYTHLAPPLFVSIPMAVSAVAQRQDPTITPRRGSEEVSHASAGCLVPVGVPGLAVRRRPAGEGAGGVAEADRPARRRRRPASSAAEKKLEATGRGRPARAAPGRARATPTSTCACGRWWSPRPSRRKLYGEVRQLHRARRRASSPSPCRPTARRWSPAAGGRQAEHVARVWDVQTGKELLQLKGHTNGVICVAWSPDGKRILTGGLDRTVRLWDAGNGKDLKIARRRPHRLASTPCCSPPTARRPSRAANEQTIGVWDLETGKDRQAQRGPHRGGARPGRGCPAASGSSRPASTAPCA